MYVGAYVFSSSGDIPANTTISAINVQANTITLSQAATASHANQTITFTVVDIELQIMFPRQWAREWGGGYSQYPLIGTGGGGPILTANFASGNISLIDTGVFQVYFSASQMQSLWPGTWDVGCIISGLDGIDVRQVFRGKLPILRGFIVPNPNSASQTQWESTF